MNSMQVIDASLSSSESKEMLVVKSASNLALDIAAAVYFFVLRKKNCREFHNSR